MLVIITMFGLAGFLSAVPAYGATAMGYHVATVHEVADTTALAFPAAMHHQNGVLVQGRPSITYSSREIDGSILGYVSETFPYNFLGAHVFSITMTTSWCYNYVTVTCHQTSLSGVITSQGRQLGFNWNGSHNSFNCYTAMGAPGNPPSGCSGNHEHMWQSFYSPFAEPNVGVEVQMTIDEEENYKGQSFFEFNSKNCPGACGNSGIS
jgi:hypothetical protein